MYRKLHFFFVGTVLIVMGIIGSQSSAQNPGRKPTLTVLVDDTTAIRFFYNMGADNFRDYFHGPLVVRVAKQGDSRLDTAPLIFHQGRTVYVLPAEMQQLLDSLAGVGLRWESSAEVESLDYSVKPLPDSDQMDLLVISSKGSWRTKIQPKKICDTLRPLDRDLRTPRALWEFQLYRQGFGCKVPGFNREAYPDH